MRIKLHLEMSHFAAVLSDFVKSFYTFTFIVGTYMYTFRQTGISNV